MIYMLSIQYLASRYLELEPLSELQSKPRPNDSERFGPEVMYSKEVPSPIFAESNTGKNHQNNQEILQTIHKPSRCIFYQLSTDRST